MLKNISIHQKKNQIIKPEWIDMKILMHENIPDKIYSGLTILNGMKSNRTYSNLPSGIVSPFKAYNDGSS